MYMEEELERWYDELNRFLFDSKLPTAIFCFLSSTLKKELILGENNVKIFVTEDLLHEDIKQIILFIIHQQVHIYCNLNDIKDCSRNRRYHNLNFKEAAEKHGLVMGVNPKDGSYVIDAKPYVWDNVEDIVAGSRWQELLAVHDDFEDYWKKQYKKSNKGLYECPECGRNAVGERYVKIICGYCRRKMNLVKREKNQRVCDNRKYKKRICPGCRRTINGVEDGLYVCAECMQEMIEIK